MANLWLHSMAAALQVHGHGKFKDHILSSHFFQFFDIGFEVLPGGSGDQDLHIEADDFLCPRIFAKKRCEILSNGVGHALKSTKGPRVQG